MTEPIDWRYEAEEWLDVGDDNACRRAIGYALLDLADAIRSQTPQLVSLRELIDAAPTADALALLMRAAPVDETRSESL